MKTLYTTLLAGLMLLITPSVSANPGGDDDAGVYLYCTATSSGFPLDYSQAYSHIGKISDKEFTYDALGTAFREFMLAYTTDFAPTMKVIEFQRLLSYNCLAFETLREAVESHMSEPGTPMIDWQPSDKEIKRLLAVRIQRLQREEEAKEARILAEVERVRRTIEQ